MDTIIERLTLDRLLEIVRGTSRTRDVSRDGETITFIYRDRDGDDLPISVFQPLSDQRLSIITGFPINEDRHITSMEASNNWNGDGGRGTTSALIVGDDDEVAICLQSHLTLKGGVTEANVQAWVSNFIGCINDWESALDEAMAETPSDSELMEEGSSAWDSIARGLAAIGPTLGTVAQGVTQGVLAFLTEDDEEYYERPRRKSRNRRR